MSVEKVVTGGQAAGDPEQPAPGPRPRRKRQTGPDTAPAATAPVETAAAGDEDRLLKDLRPRQFDEYVGQRTVVDPLSIAVQASAKRGEPLDHVLFHGPPGLGKTTLAHIIAREMGAHITHTSGPALERPADVVGLLSNLKAGDVLFIDEIHRLSHAVEEYLYSAMEDFRVDFVTGSGAFAKTISLPLEKFTLIGSTTRAGMLSAPLRDRFGLAYHLEYYTEEELTRVVTRSAGILNVKVASDAAAEIARRSRGTPRIANRLLRRVRDFTEVHGHDHVTRAAAADALKLEGVDELGLDRLDRMYLGTLAVNYSGGPAGVEALAASLNEEQQTLVDVVEPFLLKIGFIVRTPAGRRCTQPGMAHAGAPAKAGKDAAQARLV
jgi:Holliday junction DNA helicase RuvB